MRMVAVFQRNGKFKKDQEQEQELLSKNRQYVKKINEI